MFSISDFQTHIPGCVIRAVRNATKKHNGLNKQAQTELKETTLTFESEPREYKRYKCRTCCCVFSVEDIARHMRECAPGTRSVPTGPDLTVDWAEKNRPDGASATQPGGREAEDTRRDGKETEVFLISKD